jgi:hypothetical protein
MFWYHIARLRFLFTNTCLLLLGGIFGGQDGQGWYFDYDCFRITAFLEYMDGSTILNLPQG